MSAAGEEVLLARAYLSRVAEPGCLALWQHVLVHGAVATADAVRSGDVPDALRSATEARRSTADPQADLEAAERHGVRLLVPEGDGWPHSAFLALERAGVRLLREGRPRSRDRDEFYAGDLVPPAALWIRGPAGVEGLSLRSVAVVGARSATAYGDRIAKDLARRLALRDLEVVSGGALGIDAAAHRGALSAGGTTVIVSARGLDRPYPETNRRLFDQVAESGAIVSEVPPGAAPHRGRFLSRNRLIAALGTGTVVVEAARRSGARNTAAHCVDLERPLMIVPGPVTSAMSFGCHRMLIRYAGLAHLVTDAQDVLDVIGGAGDLAQPTQELDSTSRDLLDGLSRRILDGLPAADPVSVEGLAARSGVPVRELLRAVPALSAAGLLATDEAGNLYRSPAGARGVL